MGYRETRSAYHRESAVSGTQPETSGSNRQCKKIHTQLGGQVYHRNRILPIGKCLPHPPLRATDTRCACSYEPRNGRREMWLQESLGTLQCPQANERFRLFAYVGFIVGLIWYGGGVLLKYFDISLMMSTGILLTLPFIVTGFIHLDGFMDVCDALLSRKSKEDKLKILKDSRVGAFAVIALGLLFIMDFAGIYTALEKDFNLIALILIPIISRTIAAYFIISNEPLGESYYGNLFKNGTGKIDKITLGITFITILILSYFLGNKYIIMPLVMGVVGLILLKNCKKELDGINGDVAGYILVLTELFGILVLAVI